MKKTYLRESITSISPFVHRVLERVKAVLPIWFFVNWISITDNLRNIGGGVAYGFCWGLYRRLGDGELG